MLAIYGKDNEARLEDESRDKTRSGTSGYQTGFYKLEMPKWGYGIPMDWKIKVGLLKKIMHYGSPPSGISKQVGGRWVEALGSLNEVGDRIFSNRQRLA